MKGGKIAILLTAVFLFTVAGNVWSQSAGITMWSFTNEIGGIIENYFKPAHPGVRINYSIIPTEQFPGRLDSVLASGRGAPDVFGLESSFVRKYVESGLLLDLTDIYEKNRDKLIVYPAEVGTYNGRVYALSWQVCSGAMFYRRSLAKKYLGTDDPATVQQYFADLNKFLETAELLKSKSNGSCVVVSGRSDLYRAFLGSRKNPWIVNGTLVIDPVMEQFMDACKLINENGYDGRVGQWMESWFAGMQGNLRDESRRLLEVFSYFLPTWGLHYILKTNAGNTSGDWAMIPGPAPYYWGGTWIGAYKNTSNAAAVKEMIEWITTNDSFQKQYALDSGDMVSNVNVINDIKNNFSERFLGGQNHYAAFADIAKTVNGRLVQSTDWDIELIFREAVDAYVNGKRTKTQALADFRREVQSKLGIR